MGGVVELSAEAPVAVQPVDLRVIGIPASEERAFPTVEMTAWAPQEPDAVRRSISVSIVARDVDGQAALHDPDDREGSQPLSLECRDGACGGSFAVVVEWRDANPDAILEVEWKGIAKVHLPHDLAPRPEVEIKVSNAPMVTATSKARVGSGPVRLTEANRLVLWHVSLRLDEATPPNEAGWPLVVSAFIRLRSDGIAEDDTTERDSAILFVEDPRDLASTAQTRTDGWILPLRPFGACSGGEVCHKDYTIGLEWFDRRPDAVSEASWDLELRTVALDGIERPVDVSAERIDPIPLVSATQPRTTVLNESRDVAAFRYRASTLVADQPDPRWTGMVLPTRGLLRAEMRSTGSTPLPPDFTVQIQADRSAGTMLLGQQLALAFTPTRRFLLGRGQTDAMREQLEGRCRLDECGLAGEIELSIPYDRQRLVPGWEVTIDWQLELAMGTSDPTGGELTMTVQP